MTKQPESISSSAWEYMRTHHMGWLVIAALGPVVVDVFAVYLSIVFKSSELGAALFVLAWLPLITWYLWTEREMRGRFWREVAKVLEWKFQGTDRVSDESALFLSVGRSQAIFNQIVGTYKGIPVRVFESSFVIGHRHKRRYTFTAYAFRFKGTFPHCYLNNTHNAQNFAETLKPLGLPFRACNDQYELYVPREYEMEALEIFTPTTLEYLAEFDTQHDVELVGNELILFRSGYIDTSARFETDLERAGMLASHLREKLDRVHFTPVGDRPFLLREYVRAGLDAPQHIRSERRWSNTAIAYIVSIGLWVLGMVGVVLYLRGLAGVGVGGAALTILSFGVYMMLRESKHV